MHYSAPNGFDRLVQKMWAKIDSELAWMSQGKAEGKAGKIHSPRHRRFLEIIEVNISVPRNRIHIEIGSGCISRSFFLGLYYFCE
jgi:hypothetical protein